MAVTVGDLKPNGLLLCIGTPCSRDACRMWYKLSVCFKMTSGPVDVSSQDASDELFGFVLDADSLYLGTERLKRSPYFFELMN